MGSVDELLAWAWTDGWEMKSGPGGAWLDAEAGREEGWIDGLECGIWSFVLVFCFEIGIGIGTRIGWCRKGLLDL